ncbi:MAG: ATPase [Betaproteobacteria bacterium]|nr:ATPase [Betaproteobacteria bacterium]
MKARPTAPGLRRVRRDKLIQEHVHDSYKWRRKPVEPTVCPRCGAVFEGGRWQWLPEPSRAQRETCPACHRIHDKFPAGFVSADGKFVAAHHDELLHLIRNVEAKEKREHPLQRIMGISAEDGGILVTTTDIHLARGIGEALQHAYRGKLEFHYNQEQTLLRVRWSR